MKKIKREIIKIDEEKCNGCGLCIPSCKEGALRIVDGKARLVKEIYCDGIGACLGECPQGTLTIEEREADGFDEVAVERHLQKDVRETKDCHQGETHVTDRKAPLPCGCPGTMSRTLEPKGTVPNKVKSQLGQWPVQLALIPVNAPYLKGADLVILADCTAVAYANLHHDFLRGRAVAMVCPKLDDTGPYVQKLAEMIRVNDFRSIEVVMMEVPCCGGLMRVVDEAKNLAGGDVKIKETIVSLEGQLV